MRLFRPLRVATRRFSMSATSAQIQPRFSQGEDGNALKEQLASLTKPHGRWQLTDNGMGVERAFKFKTFKAAWKFMDDTAAECKKARHHPEWSNVYNQCFVRWTTHNPEGLSSADLKLATICDELASRDDSREISEPGNSDDTSTLSNLANQATAVEPDCCTPSKTSSS